MVAFFNKTKGLCTHIYIFVSVLKAVDIWYRKNAGPDRVNLKYTCFISL